MIIHVNGQAREVAPPVRLSEVLDLPDGASTTRRGIAVAVNGQVIPRSQHGSTELTDGAKVEIVTAVQGG
jgi:sulfur carrier protein